MSSKEILSGIRALKSAVKQALRECGHYNSDYHRKADKVKEDAKKLAIMQSIPSTGMSKMAVADLLIHGYTGGNTAKGRAFRDKICKAGEAAVKEWCSKNPTQHEQLDKLVLELEERELAYMVGAVKDATVKAWLSKTMSKFQSIKSKE